MRDAALARRSAPAGIGTHEPGQFDDAEEEEDEDEGRPSPAPDDSDAFLDAMLHEHFLPLIQGADPDTGADADANDDEGADADDEEDEEEERGGEEEEEGVKESCSPLVAQGADQAEAGRRRKVAESHRRKVGRGTGEREKRTWYSQGQKG